MELKYQLLLCRVGASNVNNVLSAISALTQNHRNIVELRFGLSDGELRSMSKTAKDAGISRQRVEQIERRAVEEIRRMLVSVGGTVVDSGDVRINRKTIKWGKNVIAR